MTPTDVVRAEYAHLRDAAIGVLDTMPDLGNLPPQVDTALRDLAAALRGGTLQRPEAEQLASDPFEHLLTARRYTGQQAQPIPLSQWAAELRDQLGEDRDPGESQVGEPSGNVVITELRAMIVAGLLEELAARLSPGAAFGPGRNGENLAHLAKDLAKEMLSSTFVGE
ncbi:hypothetical protein [Streptomyces sp. NPDC051993]|uniref:hypothetical protein n=1 Tax=Streptomyces sp. NPDC051993 TaxID=3155286 RepID=UPI003440330C